MSRRLLFDVETNGLLPELDRIHCLWIQDVDTEEVWDFARNDERNDIEEGVQMLMDADVLVGHNIVDFDLKAIKKVYPYFETKAKIRDTLVLARMVYANIKEHDFPMFRKGTLPGGLIGAQGLEAWGYRTGQHKGDYAKEREKELKQLHKDKGLEPPTKEEVKDYVWGEWNPEMHEYCGDDLKVNLALLDLIIEKAWSEDSIIFEHHVHALMVTMEENGFPFNKEKAEKLEAKLREEYDKRCAEAIDEIGIWWRPAKYHTSEEGIHPEYGEFDKRRTWGKVEVPKRSANFAKSNAKLIEEGSFSRIRANTVEGAPFVKVVLKEFNPGSRQQIIDRLKVLYGWTPQDFTDKGNPKVDDEVLRNLAEHIPLAETLAEIFFYAKRLGQIADGNNAWLKLVKEDGALHPRTNCGGTVSGRATHSNPNISQVPGVKTEDTKDEEEARKAAERLMCTIDDFDFNPDKGEWSWVEKGRKGEYGWECRELFETWPGYKLVGCDLSGIEFRCLGNLTYPWDDGEIVDLVLNGDIHQHNADLGGISRSIAKRVLYACMYGGGDAKLGYIVEPLASEARQKTLGRQLRAKLMAAMPSLAKAIKSIQEEARFNRGRIKGLDGRWLYVRSPHSALNLRLQSDGAIIAKKWILTVDDMLMDEGWEHGVGHEYAFNAWSHDEIQVSVREALAKKAAKIMEDAAPVAGEFFNFKCPVKAEAKIGDNWAQTH